MMILLFHLTSVFIILCCCKFVSEDRDNVGNSRIGEINSYDRFFYETDEETFLRPLSGSLGLYTF